MKVHWTKTAEGHLNAIHAYIAQNSATYALRTVDRITRKSQQIGAFPLSGRRVPEYDFDQIRENPASRYSQRGVNAFRPLLATPYLVSSINPW